MSEESLFDQAVSIPDAERALSFLDRECAGDAELRHRVEALLAANAAPDLVLDPKIAGDINQTGAYEGSRGSSSVASSGTIIAGKYKLLQQIGEGGMGKVWMADQTEPVKRRVAVKLIHTERGNSKTILARFEAERQAIALMDHPHIAKLLDAGTTELGAPYFVMDLVKGVPLTDYCDKNKLSIPERLNLFMQICSAVQHAHQKGIIHRDLKPSNILIESHDGKPVPKVIDFGLAKATSGIQLTEHTLFTAFGTVAGTPLYMAPEQATFNAVDVDTRADIYALGVILYELLTGTTPITRDTMKKAALDEMMRIIREQEAPTPSSRLSTSEAKPTVAANRQTEPARLGRFVKGELDWIVMKALSKERDRRYETPNGFAKDIERFLNHEPVIAGPPGATYRLRKFVKRNRGPVMAASLVLVALVAGVIGTTWQAIRAERQRQSAEANEVRANENATLAESRRLDAENAADDANAARNKVQSTFDAATDEYVTEHFFKNDHLQFTPPPGENETRFLERISAFYQELAATLPNVPDKAKAQLRFALVRTILAGVGGADQACADAIATWKAVVEADRSVIANRRGLAEAHDTVARIWRKLQPFIEGTKFIAEVRGKRLEQLRQAAELWEGIAGEPQATHRDQMSAVDARLMVARDYLGIDSRSLESYFEIRLDKLTEADLKSADANYVLAFDGLNRLLEKSPRSKELRTKQIAMLQELTNSVAFVKAPKERLALFSELTIELLRRELQFRVRTHLEMPDVESLQNIRNRLGRWLNSPDDTEGSARKLIAIWKSINHAEPGFKDEQYLGQLQLNLARKLLGTDPRLFTQTLAGAKAAFQEALRVVRMIERMPSSPWPEDEIYLNWCGKLAQVPDEMAATLLEWRKAQENRLGDVATLVAMSNGLHHYFTCAFGYVGRNNVPRAIDQIREAERIIALLKKGLFRSEQEREIPNSFEYAATQLFIAERLWDTNRRAEAAEWYTKGLDLIEMLFIKKGNGMNRSYYMIVIVPGSAHSPYASSIQAFRRRAEFRAQQRQTDVAVADLRACLKLIDLSLKDARPDEISSSDDLHRIPVLFELGSLLLRDGKLTEAEAALDAAVKVREDDVRHPRTPGIFGEPKYKLGDLLLGRGSLYAETGRDKEALEWYQRAADTYKSIPVTGPEPVFVRNHRSCHQFRADCFIRLGRDKDALAEWDIVLLLTPPAEQSQAKIDRARLVTLCGDHVAATKIVDEQLKAANLSNFAPYQAGCVYALSIRQVKGDDALRESYAKRAVELVQRALDAGYNDAANILHDTDLDSIRDRADFKKLMAELDKKFPPMPELIPLPRLVN